METTAYLLLTCIFSSGTFPHVLGTPGVAIGHNTFRTCNKTAETHVHIQHSRQNVSISEQFKTTPQYKKNNCTEILQMTSFSSTTTVQRNGFVHTVVDAYNGHHNLIIRPDDVWAAIMTQFSFYLNKNAEEFRRQFVHFQGKKELSVRTNGTLRTASYEIIVKAMSQQIGKNLVDPQVKKWVLPSFSTTTENDVVTVGVIFMATMKKYFNYKTFVLCGIPEITLEGTVEDWKNVYGRLEKLKEYKLDNWYKLLEPVVKQFVNARQGNVDLDFWQRIVNYYRGSGVSHISGWITVFCVFDEEGNWRGSKDGLRNGKWFTINTKDIPSGIVEVNLEIDEHGTLYNSVLFAGHMATEIKTDGCTIQPTLGWIIALQPSNKSESIPHNADSQSGVVVAESGGGGVNRWGCFTDVVLAMVVLMCHFVQ